MLKIGNTCLKAINYRLEISAISMPLLTLHYQIAGMCTCVLNDCSSWAHHCRQIGATWHCLLFLLLSALLSTDSFSPHKEPPIKGSQTLKHANGILIITNWAPQTFWALLLQQYKGLQMSWAELLFFLMCSANLQTANNRLETSATISTSLQSLNRTNRTDAELD